MAEYYSLLQHKYLEDFYPGRKVLFISEWKDDKARKEQRQAGLFVTFNQRVYNEK